MAVIKRADADRMARDAMVLDLADVTRHGQLLERQAKERAETTVANAKAERARLIAGAEELGRKQGYDAGFAEGLEAGRIQGREEAIAQAADALAQLGGTLAEAISAFDAGREGMIAEARRDIVTLAAIVAERVTKRAVEIDEQVATAQVEAALRVVARGSHAKVAVNPADVALVREAVPAIVKRLEGLKHCDIVEDESVTPGSCVVRTDGGGLVEATVEGQLARLIAEALPDARRQTSGEEEA